MLILKLTENLNLEINETSISYGLFTGFLIMSYFILHIMISFEYYREKFISILNQLIGHSRYYWYNLCSLYIYIYIYYLKYINIL